jgi:hypothetical protein
MRLKYAMLVYPVRTPWTGTNLTESLHPKNGWEVMLDGNIIRICQGTKTHTVISATMLRWAEVEEESEEAEKKQHETSYMLPGAKDAIFQYMTMPAPPPKPQVVLSELPKEAPVQPPKRRGRPPKKPV